MTVKEANKYIEKIDNEVKNLQKLLKLSEEEYEELANKLEINSSVTSIVNTSVNAMIAYRTVLKERIDNAVLERM